MLDVFQVVFEKMPKKFTSHMFSRACQKHGVEKSYLNRGVIANFLKPICIRTYPTGHSWEKKENSTYAPIQIVFKDKNNVPENEKQEIENAINLLKRNGYKVLMPKTEYKEV